jgi:DNA-directed RNA polymerase specialized sigma24 family protein
MVLETREKQRRLQALLSRLSKTICTTLVLFEIEGYTAEEIAVIQGITINTVRARIQRGRKKLLELLENSQVEGGRGSWSR